MGVLTSERARQPWQAAGPGGRPKGHGKRVRVVLCTHAPQRSVRAATVQLILRQHVLAAGGCARSGSVSRSLCDAVLCCAVLPSRAGGQAQAEGGRRGAQGEGAPTLFVLLFIIAPGFCSLTPCKPSALKTLKGVHTHAASRMPPLGRALACCQLCFCMHAAEAVSSPAPASSHAGGGLQRVAKCFNRWKGLPARGEKMQE